MLHWDEDAKIRFFFRDPVTSLKHETVHDGSYGIQRPGSRVLIAFSRPTSASSTTGSHAARDRVSWIRTHPAAGACPRRCSSASASPMAFPSTSGTAIKWVNILPHCRVAGEKQLRPQGYQSRFHLKKKVWKEVSGCSRNPIQSNQLNAVTIDHKFSYDSELTHYRRTWKKKITNNMIPPKSGNRANVYDSNVFSMNWPTHAESHTINAEFMCVNLQFSPSRVPRILRKLRVTRTSNERGFLEVGIASGL